MAEETQDEGLTVDGKPVPAETLTKVHEALKQTLQDQLSKEMPTLGQSPGRAAISGHGSVKLVKRQAT